MSFFMPESGFSRLNVSQFDEKAVILGRFLKKSIQS